MNALTSPEVAALYGHAKADRRLDKRDRIIVAAVARTGSVEMKTLMTATGVKDPKKVRERINRLASEPFGYLPAEVAR